MEMIEWTFIPLDDDNDGYYSLRIDPWECQVVPILDDDLEASVSGRFYAEVLWPNGDHAAHGCYEELDEAKREIVILLRRRLLGWLNQVTAATGGNHGTTL
ncbi:MAG: hypothetical protein KC441_05410 [Anaerolineales bacterium]|nr:hypothetical protein [Anaerolineales bacterium]